jgi:cholest-4-en-3-one 26-monooxygenase
MMEIPPGDRATLLRWAAMTVGNDDLEFQVGSSLDSRRQGNFAIYDYSRQLALKRRGGAGSDLLTAMGNAVVMGEQLTEHELGFNGDMFVLAGIETTRTALADGMLEVLRNPAERRKLQERPELLPSAIEEILRWTSPVGHILRVATADTEIRGRTIRGGDKVVVWVPSANRDEAVFADADHFDIARQPNEHIAFGYGEHFCLGRIWRAWNCAPCWKSCCAVCPTSSWPARLSGCIQSSCSDPSTCRLSSRPLRYARNEFFPCYENAWRRKLKSTCHPHPGQRLSIFVG